MTVEEKIQKKAEEYGDLAQVFIDGAEFALNNQWISVDEDLPCNHEDLMYWLGETDNVLVTGLTNKSGNRFRYISHMSKKGSVCDMWYWSYGYEPYEITHWMPYPKV